MKKKIKTSTRPKKTILTGLKGKRVLITGGLGFIGSNLAHQCLKLGAKVTICDCLDPEGGGNIHNIKGIESKVELHYDSILNFEQISRQIVKKDIIFNCAASTSHPFSMREPLTDLDANGKGVINLLEAARRFNPNIRFIHLGTSTQLGKLKYQPADEDHSEFPTDIYSANKSLSEKYVLIYGNAYPLKVTVIRLPNVFGPRAFINSSEFNFINYFIGLALQNKPITIYGTGKQLRNIIYIDDCLEAIIIASQSKKAEGQVLFVASDQHYQVAQLAKIIAKILGSGKVEFIAWPYERKVTEVGNAIISNRKIKKILGWKPKTDLFKGLAKTKKYYQKHLKHYL